jgi:hypothetical protein
MRGSKSPLDRVTVAAPCGVGWENMVGDERVRFCGQCSLNVYNLSGMTKSEAERLVAQAEGRLCIRYYRRADGTILTKDCPVGLRAIRRRAARVATACASAALSFFAGLLAAVGFRRPPLFPAAATKNEAIKIQEISPEPLVMGHRGFRGEMRHQATDQYVEGEMLISTPEPGRFSRR